MTLLYELHDQARERGVEGYRKMSKAELEVALGLAEQPGPTAVESEVRGARNACLCRAASGTRPSTSIEASTAPAPPAAPTACRNRRRLINPPVATVDLPGPDAVGSRTRWAHAR